MLQPGRKYSGGSGYRFGFNGKEIDNEVSGIGNEYDYGDRIYNTRIGKWLSIDKMQKKYPAESPYNFVSNSPIIYNDPDGKDKIYTVTLTTDKGTFTLLSFVTEKGVYTKVIDAAYIWGAWENNVYNNTITLNIDLTTREAGSTKSLFTVKSGTQFVYREKTSIAKKIKEAFSSGDGTYQEFGYVFTGNADGNMEFMDKAGKILGSYDMSSLLSAFKSAGLSAESIKEAFNSKSPLKSIGTFLESYKTYLEAGYSAAEAAEKTQELLNIKKPEVVTSVCPDCYPGEAHDGKSAKVYRFNKADGTAIDTLVPNNQTGIPDTLLHLIQLKQRKNQKNEKGFTLQLSHFHALFCHNSVFLYGKKT